MSTLFKRFAIRAGSITRASLFPLLFAPIIILLLASCSLLNREESVSLAFQPETVQFSDVTESAGLDFQHGVFRWDESGDAVAMMGGGLCWLDYDNDGWLDLYVVNSYALAEAGRWETEEGGLPRNALFHNANGRFNDVSEESGADLSMRGNGCVAADFNLDGWIDLYVTSERVNALLWNNGDGSFTQGAEEAGADAYGWQTGAAAGDLNNDGWPDLFVAGYADLNNRIPEATLGFPNTHLGRRDLLYLNQGLDSNGRATFREVGVEAGLESDNYEYGLGALMSDFDRDGDLDLLVANDTNPNRLYENMPWPGGPAADPEKIGFRFAEVGSYADIDDVNSGMGVASADYDNDGRFDVMITNLGRQLHSLYRNQTESDRISFDDALDTMGVANFGAGSTGWGISWADVDHDTDLDLIVANGTVPVLDVTNDVQEIQFLANLTAQGMVGRFQDLTGYAGFSNIEPLLSRGSAMADYDNDGDLDMAINTIGGGLVLLRNENSSGHWLTVALEGFHPGALVTAVLPDGLELLCEIKAGSSYLSTEDPRCHFGLGAVDRVNELVVRWPDGAEQRLKKVSADQFLTIMKDADASTTVDIGQQSTDDFLFQVMLRDGGAWPMEPLPEPSPEILALGEALFWDKELSGNRDVACVTCHHPLVGTGDGLSLPIGVGGTGFAAARQLGSGTELIPRNSPEIFNRGVQGWEIMFWDGRVSGTAEDGFTSPAGAALPLDLDSVVAAQAMFPVTSRDEMRGQVGDVDVFGQKNELALKSDRDPRGIWDGIMDRLLAIPEYRDLFAAVYPDVTPERLGYHHAANAIAAYEMSAFTHTDTPWDRFLAGEEEALSDSALRGAILFFGQAGCGQCHNGPLLTDQRFHNIGVPQLGPGKGDEAPHDYGRGRETSLTADMYAFRTPPLRNVELTGPWMHNGAFTTLEAAVRHSLDPAASFENYDASQLDPLLRETYEMQSGVLQTLDPLVDEPVILTSAQLNDLIAFLKALTSPSAINGCHLVPDSVPSGLPIDIDPANPCP